MPNEIGTEAEYWTEIEGAADVIEDEMESWADGYDLQILIDDEADKNVYTADVGTALAVILHGESDPRDTYQTAKTWRDGLRTMAFDVFAQDLEGELRERGAFDE